MVGNGKSQNSRKPQLMENSPHLLFSYQDILQITKIFNMYFFIAIQGGFIAWTDDNE